jgi:ribosomal protein S18 acetylase RimI-like enzyme
VKVIILKNILSLKSIKSKFIKTSNYIVKIISSKETHTVRHPVLRAGKPVDSCVFDGDNLETTLHLGILHEHKLIGVSSFFKKSNSIISSEKTQYQLRGMAVLESFQGKGLGHILLKHGENMLREKHITAIWCNAREVAINFYKKNNYQVIGKSFIIKDIGLHYTMYKNL